MRQQTWAARRSDQRSLRALRCGDLCGNCFNRNLVAVLAAHTGRVTTNPVYRASTIRLANKESQFHSQAIRLNNCCDGRPWLKADVDLKL